MGGGAIFFFRNESASISFSQRLLPSYGDFLIIRVQIIITPEKVTQIAIAVEISAYINCSHGQHDSLCLVKLHAMFLEHPTYIGSHGNLRLVTH